MYLISVQSSNVDALKSDIIDRDKLPKCHGSFSPNNIFPMMAKRYRTIPNSIIIFAIDTMPPTNPIIIICKAGIFLISFANLAKRTKRNNFTAPPLSPVGSKDRTTMKKSKLFHFHSGPSQYLSGREPSASIFATTSKINIIIIIVSHTCITNSFSQYLSV